mgnify:CR=1 FL=1
MYKIIVRNFYAYIANPLRRVYWFIFRPETRGAKTLIQFQDSFLFVRLGYAHKSWTFPGGGVKRKESFEEAARRETFEEVGVHLDKLEMFYGYKNVHEYKRDTVQCFYSKVNTPDFKIDGLEIVEAGWFTLDKLPFPRPPRVDDILRKYLLTVN